MPPKENMILQFDYYLKSNKLIFIIHADLKILNEKVLGCESNPEKKSSTKVGEYFNVVIQCVEYRYLMMQENKYNPYRGKDWINPLITVLSRSKQFVINFGI